MDNFCHWSSGVDIVSVFNRYGHFGSGHIIIFASYVLSSEEIIEHVSDLDSGDIDASQCEEKVKKLVAGGHLVYATGDDHLSAMCELDAILRRWHASILTEFRR